MLRYLAAPAGAVIGFALGIWLNYWLIHHRPMPVLRQVLIEYALAAVGTFLGFIWARTRGRRAGEKA